MQQDAMRFVGEHWGLISALVVLFGAPFVVLHLRKDSAKKLADKDPSNDAFARAEATAADLIEQNTKTGKLGSWLAGIGSKFKRK